MKLPVYFIKQLDGSSAFTFYIHLLFTHLTQLDAYMFVILSVKFQKPICKGSYFVK
jgi:hypothetical protein